MRQTTMNLVAVFALLLATGCPVLASDGDKDCDSKYAAYVPKYIRPGVDCSIDVEIFCGGPYDVVVHLTSDDNIIDTIAWHDEVNENETVNLRLGKLPFNYEGSKSFNVTVVGTHSATDEESFKNTTTDIQYQTKFLSIFIETDKAIYKPGHTIKFRAAVTTPDLLPYEGTVSYNLQDPNGNIIIRDEAAELNQGVAGSQLHLSKYSTQGEWKITFGVHGYEESLTVSVEEYVLPKFSAKIKTDQAFLHPGSEVLSGEISAKYTYGQPVRGNATVEFSVGKWWGDRIPPKIAILFPEFNGTGQFEVDALEIEKTLGWNPKLYSTDLIIVARVTDKTNGEVTIEKTTIKLHRVKIKVETLAKPEHIKPGLPYVAYLKISEQDGSLLSAEDLKSLVMEIDASYSYAHDRRLLWNEQKKNKIVTTPVKVGTDGVIIFKTTADADDFIRVDFQVKIPSYPDKNQHWASFDAERFESPSDTFLQVTTDDTSLSVGDTAKLTIFETLMSDSEKSFRLLILARGKVLENKIFKPAGYEKTTTYRSFNHSFVVQLEHSPSVYAVVSCVGPDGEFIADSVKINVQASLEHQVTISTSTNSTDAGKPVSITVQAQAGSYVGLRGIDQSVLLLKSGNDITQTKIFQDLDEYGPRSSDGGFRPIWGGWWWPWGVSGGDVSEVFENSGIIVLSDGNVYKSEPDYFPYYYYDVRFFRGAGVDLEDSDNDFEVDADRESSKSSAQQDSSRTRSYFPESWIWTENMAGDDGSVTFDYTTPDTITTWEISTFAVSYLKGLGVPKDTSKITVFRNFFISLSLPASAVRGETLAMKTTLFNYFDKEITATLTLTENEWYDLVIPSMAPDPIAAGPTRTVVIPSKDSRTIVFPIKLKKVGNARIEVQARTPVAGDAVERILLVKPEGIPKVVSHSSIIDRPDELAPTSLVKFDVDIPDDAVEGSVYVKFSVSGNILGSALSNLGNLLQMPSGCGEQTMLSFAPDVYISLYLKKVGELKGDIKQKSQDHIREGYNNELRYQHEDGSFSAFGNSDRSGSTWLTAFVVKCFIAANELNSNLIEKSKIEQATNFILNQQNENGTFREPGRVIHKEMQGGVNSDETTTAYMVIALTEGKDPKDKTKDGKDDVDAAVEKAKEFLEGRIDHIEDIYTLSIVGYALSLVESTEAARVMSVIDEQAVTEGNVKYWKKEEKGVAKCEEREEYCPFDADKPSSSSIEVTAYVLLLYAKIGRIDQVMPIVRWLVEQRGAFGGYHSTQDTVMAIQALSTVAGHFSERPTDLNINVMHSGKTDFVADFKLSDENAMILQMADLPSLAGNISVSTGGAGVADVQVTVGYNLPVGPRSSEPFVLKVNLEKSIPKKPILTICSKINKNREVVVNSTGMYVVSFKLPTGFTIDEKQATKENTETKLIELDGERVTGYFDELPKEKNICMKLVLIRYAEVAGVKPQIVEGSDYYKPERKARRLIVIEPEDICDLCGKACVGCPEKPEGPCCGPRTFPCPDFSDGLYLDSESHIMKMINEAEPLPSCIAPNGAEDSSSVNGLPASLFDGADQYILCRQKTTSFEPMLRSQKGFTISILVRPTELLRQKYYTIFSIGSEDAKRPYVVLAKKPRTTKYWVKVLLEGFQVMVRSIDIDDIPQNIWSLVTITIQRNDAKIFVNGTQKGRTVVRKQKTDDIVGEVTMKIGRSHIGGRISRGNFKGLVSTLDMWHQILTDEQIMEHYKCYSAEMNAMDPMLDLKKVHDVVPKSIRKCFLMPYSASYLKGRTGDLITACDPPSGPKPLFSPRPV